MLTSDRRRKEPLTLWRPGDKPKARQRSSFISDVTGAAGFSDPGAQPEPVVVAAEPASEGEHDEHPPTPEAQAPAPTTGFLSGKFGAFFAQVTSHSDYRATPPQAAVIPTSPAPELTLPSGAVEHVQDEESPRE